MKRNVLDSSSSARNFTTGRGSQFSCKSSSPKNQSARTNQTGDQNRFPPTGQNWTAQLHNQVIKVRAEDRHLSRDLLEAIDVRRGRMPPWQFSGDMNDAFASSSKPVIPSPLGMKAGNHNPSWDPVQCCSST
eukprot:c13696_g1_i1 orf=274-669(-)